MIIGIMAYLAIGTVLALDAGSRLRGDGAVQLWLADLAGFLVIAVCWLPIVLWAVARGRR